MAWLAGCPSWSTFVLYIVVLELDVGRAAVWSHIDTPVALRRDTVAVLRCSVLVGNDLQVVAIEYVATAKDGGRE